MVHQVELRWYPVLWAVVGSLSELSMYVVSPQEVLSHDTIQSYKFLEVYDWAN